jgi:predicted MFS family arabinose efflux permease
VSTTSVEKSAADRWYVLGVLTLVYALNIADRFAISTLIEPIKNELALSDSSVAFLTGVALALFYVTIGIPIASLADRANRRNIVAAALVIWSGMTALCGIAQNYWQLLLARIGVGVGEAGGTPPSTSLLADKFPPAQRPLALTIFALGASLGAWLGSSVAGGAADRFGWRGAFLVLGIPGLLVGALVFLTVREPPRGAFDTNAAASAPASSLRDTLRLIVRKRSAFHLLVGGSVATFWSWGLMWWTPSFLVRSYGMTVGEAGARVGPMHLVAGSLSTVFAGVLMARPAARDPRYVARLLAVVTLIATVPSLLVYALHSRVMTITMLWIFVPAVYFYIGPILGLLQNLMPAGTRAQACAVLLFTANVANLMIAPQLVGFVSDRLSTASALGPESLRWALVAVAPSGFWAAWHLWASGRTIRDEQV